MVKIDDRGWGGWKENSDVEGRRAEESNDVDGGDVEGERVEEVGDIEMVMLRGGGGGRQ